MAPTNRALARIVLAALFTLAAVFSVSDAAFCAHTIDHINASSPNSFLHCLFFGLYPVIEGICPLATSAARMADTRNET